MAENFIGKSKPVRELFRVVEKVAGADKSVLITGEPGTGKQLIAEAIHYNSKRKDEPIAIIDCLAVPEKVLEIRLFGCEQGAFPGVNKARQGHFELAKRGTIYLDEVGGLSPNLQLYLLRVLKKHEFERVGGITAHKIKDVRLIAGTAKNLVDEVSRGTFRKDLYYFLNVLPVEVPPLRERRPDIPLLVHFFLKKLGNCESGIIKTIAPEAMDALTDYDWPGNVRELKNIVQRLSILCDGQMVQLDDVSPWLKMRGIKGKPSAMDIFNEGISCKQALEAYEKELLLTALNRTNWVKAKASKLLKMNRTTLIARMRSRELHKPRP